jgi:hypothetical protein
MDALVWGLSFLFEKMTGRRRKKEDEDQYELKDVVYQDRRIYEDTSWMA